MRNPSSMSLLGYAATLLGVAEIEGHKHDSRIVAMLRHVGIKRGGDETPWCAAFVNWVLFKVHVTGTHSAMARSFCKWGEPVEDWRENIRPGDIVVLWRKSRTSPSGHVAFFQRFEGRNHVMLLGGNQRNRVMSKRYSIGRVLDVRRLGVCRD